MTTRYTRAMCDKFAQANNMTFTIERFRDWGEWYVSYSVDLPEGMITDTGCCGMSAEDEGTMSQAYEAVWSCMDELASAEWLTIEQALARGINA